LQVVPPADPARIDETSADAHSSPPSPHLVLVTADNEAAFRQAAQAEQTERVRPFTTGMAATEAAELTQARQTYGEEDELALSILENGLLNPVDIAYLTEFEAQNYLRDLNAWHGSKHKLGDPGKDEDDLGLVPDENGMYRFMIAGHRRRRAMKIASQMASLADGHEPDSAYLPMEVKVFPHIDFFAAKKIQLTENERKEVEGPEEALELAKYYDMGRNRDEFGSIDECAESLGMSSYKISRSLFFSRLPRGVQNLALEQKLQYTTAVEMHRLMSCYDNREMYDIARRAAKNKWSGARMRAEVTKLVAIRSLPDEVRELYEKKFIDDDIAIQISKLKGAMSPEEMASFARRGQRDGWDMSDWRWHVQAAINNASEDGKNLFTVNEEYSLTEAARLRLEEERLHAGNALARAVQAIDEHARMAIAGLDGGVEPLLPHHELEKMLGRAAASLAALNDHKSAPEGLADQAAALADEIERYVSMSGASLFTEAPLEPVTKTVVTTDEDGEERTIFIHENQGALI
jgi:ParB-like chromosome segregation protein Spo0J